MRCLNFLITLNIFHELPTYWIELQPKLTNQNLSRVGDFDEL